MKAIDIATTNHVSPEDVITICSDLGIPCDTPEADLSEKDVFLIEKKIEVIKEQRAKAAKELIKRKNERGDKSGAKIKLKRKVHVSKELIKEKQDEEARKKKTEQEKEPAGKAPADKAEPRRTEQAAGRKPGAPGDRPRVYDKKTPPAGIRDRRPPGPDSRRDREPGAPDKPAEGKDAVVLAEKEKRKKSKEKEKEKDTKKSLYKQKVEKPEKDIFRKKKPGKRSEPEVQKPAVTPKQIEITESVSVGDLAKKLNVKAKEVIAKLMRLGMMATINQIVEAETAEILCAEYGTEVRVVSLYDETVIKQAQGDKTEDNVKRPPIVTVMGHVDHGKTKLLDAIRQTNVTEGEFGGITQHIGAYTVAIKEQQITFLDTPGHEAFTTMRARGASVTDIVVLVVAANDGVMPQTIEAINHAKDAGVPIIVAINKIDLPDVNIQKIKQELANYELVPEEWGGTTLFAEVSAKQKTNINELLELILIQAEMLELSANPDKLAKGKRANPWIMVFYPPFVFLRSYLFKRSYLHGWAGFINSVSMAYYAFLKYAKLYEHAQFERYGDALMPEGAPPMPPPPSAPR